jgi:hypothetical protein
MEGRTREPDKNKEVCKERFEERTEGTKEERKTKKQRQTET